jgi:hypothetical protein
VSTTTIHKLYWDFEKEERWLNEMAAKGLDLVGYSWGTYRFEHGTPGEWTYRIELLPETPAKSASLEYLSFTPLTVVNVVNMTHEERSVEFVLPLMALQVVVVVLMATESVRLWQRVKALREQKRVFE